MIATRGLVLDVARQRGGASPGVATLLDHSRWGNNGTIVGATFGQLPSGLWYQNYNGTTNYTNCGSDSSLANIFDGGGAIECWAYARSSGEVDRGQIFNKIWQSAFAGEMAGLMRLTFRPDFDVTNGYWYSARDWAINTWYHIVVTYNADSIANNPLFYKNGVAQGVTEGTAPAGTRTDDSGSDLHICTVTGGHVFAFDGLMTKMRIFNYTLSPGQILKRFEATRTLFGV